MFWGQVYVLCGERLNIVVYSVCKVRKASRDVSACLPRSSRVGFCLIGMCVLTLCVLEGNGPTEEYRNAEQAGAKPALHFAVR